MRPTQRTVSTTDRVVRRLAAILAIDMVGYSRHMEADEAGTIARQKSDRQEQIDPVLQEHGGRVVKTTGDGLLVEFGSILEALDSAVRIQRAIAETEANARTERRIQDRAGVNLGDIVIDGDDILGDGVNIAARLDLLRRMWREIRGSSVVYALAIGNKEQMKRPDSELRSHQ